MSTVIVATTIIATAPAVAVIVATMIVALIMPRTIVAVIVGEVLPSVFVITRPDTDSRQFYLTRDQRIAS